MNPDVVPLWVILILSGAALVVLALAVERALRRAAGGELSGFTAAPLFSDERRQQALQIAPVVAGFASPARPVTGTGDEGLTGEGGKFGGAGASERF